MTTPDINAMSYDQCVRHDRAFARTQFDAFFGPDCRPYRVLRRVTAWLNALGLPYALAGEMAWAEHGYRKVRGEIELVLRPGDAATLCRTFADLKVDAAASREGRGVGTACGVRVTLLTAGVGGAPDPAAAVAFDGLRVLTLPALVGFELSDITPRRYYGVAAAVMGVIAANGLTADFADLLPQKVRTVFLGLHRTSVERVDPHVERPSAA